MKSFKIIQKIASVMLILISALALQAQKSNHYNQKGIDIVSSMKIIEQDYRSGKFSGLSDEAVNYYVKSLPVKVENIQTGLVSNIVSSVRSNTADVASFINNSTLSEYSKQTFKDLLAICKASDALVNLNRKSTEISASSASQDEKELALTLTSVLYNYVSDYTATASTSGTANASNTECYVNGQPAPCTTTGAIGGAIIGAVVGYTCCGPVGAIVGAIVGGVVGGAIGSLC